MSESIAKLGNGNLHEGKHKLVCLPCQPLSPLLQGQALSHPVKVSELEEWVTAQIRAGHYKNAGKVAKAAGLTHGAFTRQLKNGSLGLEPLLRLSLATGESASAMLRRAGKSKLAALIEECYGEAKPISPAVREVVTLLAQLPADVAQSQAMLLRAAVAHWRAVSGTGTAPSVAQETSRRTRARRVAQAR
jgi:hypothetical protein